MRVGAQRPMAWHPSGLWDWLQPDETQLRVKKGVVGTPHVSWLRICWTCTQACHYPLADWKPFLPSLPPKVLLSATTNASSSQCRMPASLILAWLTPSAA